MIDEAVYSLADVKLYVDFSNLARARESEEDTEFTKIYEVRIVSADDRSDDAAIYVSNGLLQYMLTVGQILELHNAERDGEASINKHDTWFLDFLKEKPAGADAPASEKETHDEKSN